MTVRIHAAVLAVCLGTLGTLAAQAQTDDTAYGTGPLQSNTSGSYGAAFGYNALSSNTTAVDNSAFGSFALSANTSGQLNTAVGYSAGVNNTTGWANTAIGASALRGDTTGLENTAIGAEALSGSVGSYNTATGVEALHQARGNGNTATGMLALSNLDSGGGTIAIGYGAGNEIYSGSGNIAIGNTGTNTDNDAIRIGTTKVQTSFYAAGIDGVQISSGVPVYIINSDGQLGTVNSSIRFKEDVHDMAGSSDKLFQLRPVTYRYKQVYADGSKPADYGLIAEEVAQVYPDMVARDASGEILTVHYQKLTPMLLNELQKQHRTIDMLEQRLSALEATSSAAKPDTKAAAE